MVGSAVSLDSVLVIDDEDVPRELLRELLEMSGYKVFTATSGDEGVRSFDRERQSLVITDVRMPGADGMEVLRRVREIDPLVPVVVVTGHGDLETAISALRQGAFDLLQKPINPELLLKVVRQAVEHVRLRRFEKEHTRLLESEIEARTRELAQTNDFLRGILNSSSGVSIILTDFNQNVLFWNSGAEKIFGYSADEMIGSSITQLYVADRPNLALVDHLRSMMQDKAGAVHAKVRQRAKDGRVLTISLHISPMLDATGQVRGILGLGQDVTSEEQLVEQLSESYSRIKRMQESSIFAMAKLAESRDGETAFHLHRLKEYCLSLCRHLRSRDKFSEFMTDQFIEDLAQSSILHDIGKVGLPDAILFNSGRFGSAEYEIMKNHTILGGRSLEEAAIETGEEGFLSMARDIAYYHHEHWDGGGYPEGRVQESIPLAARIVAIADVYDALTSERRYKRAFSHEEACALIIERRGKQFDPDLVDAFVNVSEEFRKIRQTPDEAPFESPCQLEMSLWDMLPPGPSRHC